MASRSVLLNYLRRSGFLHLGESVAEPSRMCDEQLGPLGLKLKAKLHNEWLCSVRTHGRQLLQHDMLEHEGGDQHQAHTHISAQGLRRDMIHKLLSSHKLPSGLLYQHNPTDSHETSSPASSCMGAYWLVPAALSTNFINDCAHFRLKWWKQHAVSPANFNIEISADDTNVSAIQYTSTTDTAPCNLETLHNHKDEPLVQEVANSVLLQRHLEETGSLPHVLSTSCNMHRAAQAYLQDAYRQRPHTDNLPQRQHVKLSYSLAPYVCSVTPEGGASAVHQREVAAHIRDCLQREGLSLLYHTFNKDETKTLYTRCDDMGIPFNICVTDDTLSTGLVQLRNRDTTLTEEVLITQLPHRLTQYVNAREINVTHTEQLFE